MAAPVRTPEAAIRSVLMAYEFIHGATLQEIGDRNGITRERVRQIISGLGIKSDNGGRAVTSMVSTRYTQSAKQAKKDARAARVYGCDHATAVSINSGKPFAKNGTAIARFNQQRKNAAVRGVEWSLTLPEWWAIWQESGHWNERGRGRYVMARIGDTGGYCVDNVEIITQSQNSSDSYLKTPASVRVAKARITRAKSSAAAIGAA